jgi:predicted nucleic acid-binding protein
LIVVDTNVISYLFIQGEKTTLAQEVHHLDPSWIVPTLWRHEFLNVLATYARRGGGSLEEVQDVWQRTLVFLARRERQADMGLALELAVQYGISAYDAQYIALAQQAGTYCITEDGRLIRIFPAIAMSMEDFCGLAY